MPSVENPEKQSVDMPESEKIVSGLEEALAEEQDAAKEAVDMEDAEVDPSVIENEYELDKIKIKKSTDRLAKRARNSK